MSGMLQLCVGTGGTVRFKAVQTGSGSPGTPGSRVYKTRSAFRTPTFRTGRGGSVVMVLMQGVASRGWGRSGGASW